MAEKRLLEVSGWIASPLPPAGRIVEINIEVSGGWLRRDARVSESGCMYSPWTGAKIEVPHGAQLYWRPQQDVPR